MAEKTLLLGAPNVLLGASAFYDSTPAASMPISNLFNEEPSKLFRITEASTYFDKTWVTALCSAASPVDAVVWGNHNAATGATFRIMCYDDGVSLYGCKAVTPDALVSSTNLTGVVGDIDDDPLSPDVNNLGPTVSGLDTMALVGFVVFPGGHVPATGANSQCVLLNVYRNSSSGTAPKVTVKIYESGVLRGSTSVTNQDVTSVGGEVIRAYWDGALLTDTTGASFEVRVEGTAGSVASVGIKAIRPLMYYMSGTATLLGDSGWQAVPLPSSDPLWGSTLATEQLPMKNIHYVFGSQLSGVLSIVITLRDAANSAPMQAGYMIAGPKLTLTRDAVYGPVFQVVDPSTRGETAGGQFYGSSFRRKRRLFTTFSSLTSAEAVSLCERIDWLKGKTGAVFVSLFPDDTTLKQLTSALCVVEDLSELTAAPAVPSSGQTKIFSKSYTWLEKL